MSTSAINDIARYRLFLLDGLLRTGRDNIVLFPLKIWLRRPPYEDHEDASGFDYQPDDR